MDSGNNNSNQTNSELPAIANSSIRSLSNQVWLLSEVIQERDPVFWYEKAIVAFESAEQEKAKYYCNKAILISAKFSEGYLLRAYISNSISSDAFEDNDFNYYKDLVSSFTVDFIKSFIEGQFPTGLLFDNEVKGDVITDSGGETTFNYGYEYRSLGIESDVFRLNKKYKPKHLDNDENTFHHEIEEFFSQKIVENFEANQKPTVYLSIAICIFYSIKDIENHKFLIEKRLKHLSTILEYFQELKDPIYLKWVYLIAALVSRYLFNAKLATNQLQSPIEFINQSMDLDPNFLPACFFKALLLSAERGNNTSDLFTLVLSQRSDLNQKMLLFYARHNEKCKLFDLAKDVYYKLIHDLSAKPIIKGYSYWGLGDIERQLNDSGFGYYEAYPLYIKAEELGVEPKLIPYGGIAGKLKQHGQIEKAIKFYLKAARFWGHKSIKLALDELTANGLIEEAISNGQIEEVIKQVKFCIEKTSIDKIDIPTGKITKKDESNIFLGTLNDLGELSRLYKQLGLVMAITGDLTFATNHCTAVLKLIEETRSLCYKILQGNLNLLVQTNQAIAEINKATSVVNQPKIK